MSKLFNPFKQAQRLAGGTGLGLYSLAMRMDALQGQYGVSKRPDGAQGSLFWFTIPYRPDEMSAGNRVNRSASNTPHMQYDTSVVFGSELAHENAEHTAHHKEDTTAGDLNVLVVDDAPMIVKMTSMLLKRKGHNVQAAVNGA